MVAGLFNSVCKWGFQFFGEKMVIILSLPDELISNGVLLLLTISHNMSNVLVHVQLRYNHSVIIRKVCKEMVPSIMIW